METIQVKVLDLGYMTFYKKELVRTNDDKEMIYSPALAILIKHPTAGYILYDTGNDDAWRDSYTDHIKEVYPISECLTIKEALAKEGLTPEDIDVLILSHLHFDHAGGMKYFANTKAGAHTLVAGAELEEVQQLLAERDDKTSGAYIGKLFLDLPGVHYEAVADGETELAAGVTLFVQHCHTAGLIGMKVQLPGTRFTRRNPTMRNFLLAAALTKPTVSLLTTCICSKICKSKARQRCSLATTMTRRVLGSGKDGCSKRAL